MRAQPVAVTLSESQRREAWQAARDTRDWHQGHPPVRQFTSNQLVTDMRAYCAEIAASVVRGVPWRGANPATRRNGDLVDDTEVRSTLHPRGRLLIAAKDCDQRAYVLVTGHPPTMTVRGWMRALEAKRNEWWWASARQPCWAVPQSELWDIATLEAAMRYGKALKQ